MLPISSDLVAIWSRESTSFEWTALSAELLREVLLLGLNLAQVALDLRVSVDGHSRFGVPPLVARSLKPCAMVCALAIPVCASLFFRPGVEVGTKSATTCAGRSGAAVPPVRLAARLNLALCISRG